MFSGYPFRLLRMVDPREEEPHRIADEFWAAPLCEKDATDTAKLMNVFSSAGELFRDPDLRAALRTCWEAG